VLPAATFDDTNASRPDAGGAAGAAGSTGAGGGGNRDAAAGSAGVSGSGAGGMDGDVRADANDSAGSGGRGGAAPDVSVDGSDGTSTDAGEDAATDFPDSPSVDASMDAVADASDGAITDSRDALADSSDATAADAPDTAFDSNDASTADSPSDGTDSSSADVGSDGIADAGDGAPVDRVSDTPGDTYDAGPLLRWPDSPTAFCSNGSASVACNTVTRGQDGTYAINVPTYVTDKGIVTDSVTRLFWRQNLSASMAFAGVANYCSMQTTGGLTWRVPTFLELLSTTDYGTRDPASQVGDFGGGVTYLWSSDSAFDTTSAWTFQSASGAMQPLGKTQTFPRVRCVSGATFAGTFVVQSDTSILDQRTNLSWGPDVGSMTWGNAISACENYSLGSATDFRLPSLKELATLIAPGRSPTYDPVFTDIPASAVYATSTPSASSPASYWVVQLDSGTFNPAWTIASQTARVRCVR
jgi:hypothetical protein